MDMPSYPARPINGGPLERARPKTGTWMYEPKLNGWRAIIHAPSGRMYNRHGERLSIEECFKPALDILANADVPEWLDCEALERRLQLGRGSLVIFDYLPSPKQRRDTYTDRKAVLLSRLKALPNWKPLSLKSLMNSTSLFSRKIGRLAHRFTRALSLSELMLPTQCNCVLHLKKQHIGSSIVGPSDYETTTRMVGFLHRAQRSMAHALLQ
jgi:hypothetical protein